MAALVDRKWLPLAATLATVSAAAGTALTWSARTRLMADAKRWLPDHPTAQIDIGTKLLLGIPLLCAAMVIVLGIPYLLCVFSTEPAPWLMKVFPGRSLWSKNAYVMGIVQAPLTLGWSVGISVGMLRVLLI